MRRSRYHARSHPDTTGCCQCRPVASDDVELRRNPRASAPRPPWDRTNNLRVGRPTGRQHRQLTLRTSSGVYRTPPLGSNQERDDPTHEKGCAQDGNRRAAWCACTAPPLLGHQKIHRPINSDGCRGCSSISWSKVILTIWSKLCCSHLSLSRRRTAHAQHSSTPLQCNLSGRA